MADLSLSTPARAVGEVFAVRGAKASIVFAKNCALATVGDFIAIEAARFRFVGVVTEVESDGADSARARAGVDVLGEFSSDARGGFRRGVSTYPAIGDRARALTRSELRRVYEGDPTAAVIGALSHDEAVPARISLTDMLNRHFAVLGSTGVGKSSGVAVILNAILENAPQVRAFLLDGHNEFARCFGARANVVDPANLKLPFWLFNYEELIDIVYAGRAAAEQELELLLEYIPVAKGMYLAHRQAQSDPYAPRKNDPRRAGFAVDTPTPYLIQDLLGLIDERMGKLDNRANRMHCHRLLARLDALQNDPRYAFMFQNANVGGDTMAEILTHLFRLEPDGRPLTVMQLAGLPAEVVDSVVCVLARLAFDFGLWSDGAFPLLFVCEEAHRYAPADRNVRFAPTRRALMRIAKEGRKCGVYLGLVSQRPAELDPAVLSQCNTLFAMRLANERDQALLRSAVSDAAANLIDFVPALGLREAVAFGDGLPLPTRLRFTQLDAARLPQSETFRLDERRSGPADREIVRHAVDRWRRAQSGARALDAPSPEPAPLNAAAARLEQLRAQILKRGPA